MYGIAKQSEKKRYAGRRRVEEEEEEVLQPRTSSGHRESQNSVNTGDSKNRIERRKKDKLAEEQVEEIVLNDQDESVCAAPNIRSKAKKKRYPQHAIEEEHHDEENNVEEVASPLAGAYAVNGEVVVRRTGEDDALTIMPEEMMESVQSPPLSRPSPHRGDSSVLHVQSELVKPVDDMKAEINYLQAENERLQSSPPDMPVVEAEVAQEKTINKKGLFICIALGVMVLAGVVVAVTVSLSNSGSNSSSETQSRAESPTSAPESPSSAPTIATTISPTGVPWLQIGEKVNGKVEGDEFGRSVALSSDGMVMVVGTRTDSTPSYVSVLRFDESTRLWMLQQDLSIGTDVGSVSINSDGSVLAVGSISGDTGGVLAGLAQAYERDTETDRWVQRGNDIIGERERDYFGQSISLSGAGDVLAVGASPNISNNNSRPGSVRIFKYNLDSSSWEQLGQTLTGLGSNDRFGQSVSLSKSGNIIAVGAWGTFSSGRDAGRVTIYQFSPSLSEWAPMGSPIDGERDEGRFGLSLSLDDSGFIVAVGEVLRDFYERVTIFAFDSATSAWGQRGQPILVREQGSRNGISVSLSGNGAIVAVGSGHGGGRGQVAVFQYEAEAPQWNQLGEVILGDAISLESFGNSVALSADGRVVAVGDEESDPGGMKNAGSVYAFTRQ